MITSAQATHTAMNLENVCPAHLVKCTTKKTVHHFHFVLNLFRCVDLVLMGKFHADSTIFKYFKAKFVVLFHVFLWNCPSLAVIGI